MATPTELIEGVTIISQYETTYYPDNFGGLIFFMILFFLCFCCLFGLLLGVTIEKDGNTQFYVTIGFLTLISFIFTIGLFRKIKSIDIYDITRYKVSITDTAKYNGVNNKLYIIKEDHGVYDVYLKSDMIKSD